jgi:hypothetical protein
VLRTFQTLVFSAVVLTAALVGAGLPAPPPQAAVERRLTSPVVVALPAEDAELAVDGETIPGLGVVPGIPNIASRRPR